MFSGVHFTRFLPGHILVRQKTVVFSSSPLFTLSLCPFFFFLYLSLSPFPSLLLLFFLLLMHSHTLLLSHYDVLSLSVPPTYFLHPSPLLSFSLSLPLFISVWLSDCDFYCITQKRKMKMKIPFLILKELKALI